MKIMPCPLNGPRNISEFVCAGEVLPAPNPGQATDSEWADYVFMRANEAGAVLEWWMHVPTAYWFIAERDTRTDRILRTFPASELFREQVRFKPGGAPAGGEP